jgi:hypothetical protein
MTWKLEPRELKLSSSLEHFSPQAKSVGLMERLEQLGSNRESTRVSFR